MSKAVQNNGAASKEPVDLGPGEYTPTEAEIAAIRSYGARKDARPPTPKIKLEETEDGYRLWYDHVSQGLGEILIENSIGVSDRDFLQGITQHLVNATQLQGEVSEKMLNFAFSVLRGIKPKDELEVMLAAQMAAVHIHTMHYSQQLAGAKNFGTMQAWEPGLNKLARTFTTQIEALKRYRSKGEQVVRVERVYVGEGGQAVVGNLNQGGSNSQTEDQNHEGDKGRTHLAAPLGAPLPITFEANREALRLTSGERKDPVPIPRGTRRRAEG